ncbi:hypothetical protein D3C87_431020 [compost metagenome]
MKTKLIPLLIGVCTMMMLTNCTIEKRLFQKGYHVEWKKKAPHDQASGESNKLPAPSDDLAKKAPEKASVPNPDTESPLAIAEKTEPATSPSSTATQPADKVPTSGQKADSKESISIKNETASTPPNQKDEEDPEPQTKPKTFEPVGISSFSLYFIGLTLGIVGILAANPVGLMGISALLLLSALVLGIVSVVRSHRHKEWYKPNFFGYFGMIASASTLIIFVIALTLYAILVLSSWPG